MMMKIDISQLDEQERKHILGQFSVEELERELEDRDGNDYEERLGRSKGYSKELGKP